ncbi:hypothetical protein [Enorma massiliensis]|uniref:Uncharacterized protein n=1 Tax=Enorma massiliensis TaxID=1472761 RepID=A0A1Y3TZD3_9ACTN|nr:hypothetical protein [Enorma massiliensis]OUN41801.1 hypothetical protein B5G21_09180 [Enorma massiliensis]
MAEGLQFIGIKLSNGRVEIVPGSLVLLNPELEGKRRRVWGVWAFDALAPCDLVGAAEGRCLGPLMGYLSDRDDLWRRGSHRFEGRSDASERRLQVLSMLLLAIATLEQSGAVEGEEYGLAWAMFDMASTGGLIPMGRTDFIIEGR